MTMGMDEFQKAFDRLAAQQKVNAIRALAEFIGDHNIDDEWLVDHAEIRLDETTKTVQLTIDNCNDQEFGWIQEALLAQRIGGK